VTIGEVPFANTIRPDPDPDLHENADLQAARSVSHSALG